MTKKYILASVFLMISATGAFAGTTDTRWGQWNPDVFKRASVEHKLVILDLQAVWCHWCHVMEETTYQDAQVQKLLDEKFIAVKADQEAYPDLAARYENWGWPATIVFAPDGTEIVKRRGYIPPARMADLLEAIIKDPTPGPSVLPETAADAAGPGALPAQNKQTLEAAHETIYDQENDGWGGHYKLIDSGNLEYAIGRSLEGDKKEETRVRSTLDKALNLLDPVWGGFFQYSDELDWKSPHFEKIMPIQSAYIRHYADAYTIWKDSRYLSAAEAVYGYVKNFWTDAGGAFYTSQDADVSTEFLGKKFYALSDKDRRSLGKMPRIDTHIYARENGWMISALAELYEASGDTAPLASAVRAAEWIIANRARLDGGFDHGEKDRSGPFLEDTLSMGRAFMDLYTATGDRRWLARSESAAQFIEKNFRQKDAGYVMVLTGGEGVFAKPLRQTDAQIILTRWTNLLARYSGKPQYRAMAEHAMKYLTSAVSEDKSGFSTGILVADRELASEPAHVTVIGAKSDKDAQALHRTALTYPALYKRMEWWDRAEGDLPGGDVTYPDLGKPAAFLCANQSCSLPYFKTETLLKAIEREKTHA